VYLLVAAVAPRKGKIIAICFRKRRRFATKWYIKLSVKPIIGNRLEKLELRLGS